MDLTGEQRMELQNALCDAFSGGEFEQLVRHRLDDVLGNVAKPGPLRQVVFEVISAYERLGIIEKLIQAVIRERPDNKKIQNLIASFGINVEIQDTVKRVDKPTSPTITFPVIRLHRDCYYEPYTGEVNVGWDKETAKSVGMRFVGYGGDLKDKYSIGFWANPLIKGNTATFSDPAFELVVRNESERNVVVASVGMRINVKLMVPHAGPQVLGVRIPFDDVRLDTAKMGYGDTKFVDIDPVVLGSGCVHGLRIQLLNWDNLLLQVIQFIVRVDSEVVATPEIYLRY
jgi:hypothetical protein